MKALYLASTLAVAALLPAAPAVASVIMVDASSIQGANVLYNQGEQTGTTVFGNTNLGANTVAFTGTTVGGGNIIRANGGQARVEGALDVSTQNPNDTLLLSSLQFELTNNATLNNLEFNLLGGTATSATISIIDNMGELFTFPNLALGNGENFFGFQGINNETIDRVSIALSGGGLGDLRQLRLDAIAPGGVINPTGPVPEPATWLMVIFGFATVGYSLRRRRAHRTQQAV